MIVLYGNEWFHIRKQARGRWVRPFTVPSRRRHKRCARRPKQLQIALLKGKTQYFFTHTLLHQMYLRNKSEWAEKDTQQAENWSWEASPSWRRLCILGVLWSLVERLAWRLRAREQYFDCGKKVQWSQYGKKFILSVCPRCTTLSANYLLLTCQLGSSFSTVERKCNHAGQSLFCWVFFPSLSSCT